MKKQVKLDPYLTPYTMSLQIEQKEFSIGPFLMDESYWLL